MTKIAGISIALCLLTQTSIIAPAPSDTNPSYRVDQYPVLEQRIPFLKERLLSQNPHIRYRTLGEIRAYLPLSEAEQLLRQIMKQDDFEMIQQQALIGLISNGYIIDKAELPKKIADIAGVDRTDTEAVKRKLAELRGEDSARDEGHRHGFRSPSIKDKGADAGHAARILGLLGDESDILRLKPLLKHENIYVRFSTATALMSLGDVEAGKAALGEIADAPVIPENLLYIRTALLALDRLGDEAAIHKFVLHLQTLEQSDEVNTQNHYVTGMSVLANRFRLWKNNAQEWQEWLQKRQK